MKNPIVAALVATSVLATVPALAGKDIPYDQLPPAVQQSVEKLTPPAAVQEVEVEVELETKTDAVYYEIEYLRDGVKWEIYIAQDGRILRHEQD